MWQCPFWLFTIFYLSHSYGYVIEGTIVVPPEAPPDWHINTRINVAGDQFVGFVKTDGSFEVTNVASGSYIIEAINPVYYFQGVRVDISSKGRIRARQLNAPQPNAVKELPYPLRLSTSGRAVYFKAREQLRTLDLLFNPNVLYVLVPLLLVMILTKLVNTNDPDVQKEMQQMNILNPQQQLPDMSEFLSSLSLFSGNSKKTATSSATNKRKSLEKHRQINSGATTSESSNQYNSVNSSSTASVSSSSASRRSTAKSRKAE
uniref:ER membrane protein complex subunit 7 beta-sandwich domain-containing protein n=1 Tax=Schistosoma japonicum TaxID=6182 RepID=C1LHE2_SCHJA|nr:hypothetical protein [Schistosoma japonicum]